MSWESWLIYGAGGHGRVVLDILRERGVGDLDIAFIDDRPAGPNDVHGIRAIWGPRRKLKGGYTFIVAVGPNEQRMRIAEQLLEQRQKPGQAVHPTASVSDKAVLGGNVVVCAHAHVGPGANIGDHCIVNTGACIDHDCVIEAGCHIAPNATLCGEVYVGKGCLIGAGATLLPGSRVHERAIVGAGALLLERNRVPPGATVTGVPIFVPAEPCHDYYDEYMTQSRTFLRSEMDHWR
ncbi:MAG TPA: acetyltransferase [Phycisphaerae bacterium]|nr:acetyltransferase [Phycisphaerae bacterium]